MHFEIYVGKNVSQPNEKTVKLLIADQELNNTNKIPLVISINNFDNSLLLSKIDNRK